MSRRAILFSLWLAAFIQVAAISVYSPLIPAMQKELGFSFSEFGLMTSAFFLPYTILQVPAGHAADRGGTRRLVTVGLLSLTASTILLGWVSDLSYALLLRAIAGGAAAGIFVPAIRSLTMLYPKRAGAAVGVLGASVGAGSLYVSLVGPVLSVWAGWRLALGMLMLPGFLVLGIFGAYFSEKPVRSSGRNKSFPVQILRHQATWLLGYQQFTRLGVVITLLTWLPTFFVAALGYDLIIAGIALGLVSAISIVSNPVGGTLADRIRSHSIVTGLSFGVLAIALVLTGLFPEGIIAWFLVLIIGWFAFAHFGPLFAILAKLFGEQVAGFASGLQNMLASIGGILIPFLFGYLRDVTGGFVASWVSLAVLCLAGVLVEIPLFRLEAYVRKRETLSRA